MFNVQYSIVDTCSVYRINFAIAIMVSDLKHQTIIL